MKSLRPLILLAALLTLSACAGKKETHYRVLRHSSFQYPYTQPIKIYLRTDRDRSGADYLDKMGTYDLGLFRDRITRGLARNPVKIVTYTASGAETKLKLRNPFLVVVDSTKADLMVDLFINSFDESVVEVTTDRLMIWSSYGILTHAYVGYQRVPRMLVEVEAQLREIGESSPFYAIQARGISVNRPTRREGFKLAMDRAEVRFYERFLKR